MSLLGKRILAYGTVIVASVALFLGFSQTKADAASTVMENIRVKVRTASLRN